MGQIIIRDSAKANLLTQDRQTYLSTLKARIYVNNTTPDPALGNGQFTECSDSGYSPQIPTFGAPVNTGGKGVMTAPNLVNTVTLSGGGFTGYGVYYTDPANAEEWVYGFRGAAPIVITLAGQNMVIAPRWENDSEP